MLSFLNFLTLLLAQNEAQKHETFLVLALFALVACVFIAGCFGPKPYTKEKQIQKPLLIIAIMALFVFFVVYIVYASKK